MHNLNSKTRGEKALLRKQMITWRESVSLADREEQSIKICNHLLKFTAENYDLFKKLNSTVDGPKIALYNAFRGEVDLSWAWSRLLSQGWTLLFPRIIEVPETDAFVNKMIFVPLQLEGLAAKLLQKGELHEPVSRSIDKESGQSFIKKVIAQSFKTGHFSLLEPIMRKQGLPDLIVLPGLAFDKKGQRLGWGKGYYDTYLATATHEYLTLAAALEGQMVDHVPTCEHDQRAHGLLTTGGIIKTNIFPFRSN